MHPVGYLTGSRWVASQTTLEIVNDEVSVAQVLNVRLLRGSPGLPGASGRCCTGLTVWQGRRVPAPLLLRHEGAGFDARAGELLGELHLLDEAQTMHSLRLLRREKHRSSCTALTQGVRNDIRHQAARAFRLIRL